MYILVIPNLVSNEYFNESVKYHNKFAFNS
jgi:hypothetical protein